MNTGRAVDIITKRLTAEIVGNTDDYNGGRLSGCTANNLANLAINTLASQGWAVVELPDETVIPTGWGEDCIGCWPVFDSADDPVSAWPERGRGIADSAGKFMSIAEARAIAAALLAAADAAERQLT